MKPNEECCRNPYAENPDYEISPIELVQDVSILVLEGRLPEFSTNGRKEGDHCWPVSLDSKKQCCFQRKYKDSSMCNFVQSARRKVRSLWTETVPVFIEVLVCLDSLFPIGQYSNSAYPIGQSKKDNLCPSGQSNKEPCEVFLDHLPRIESQKILLLERWKMDVQQKDANASSSSLVSINMFLQAVRSFLHFSQLSAWLIKTGGRIPSQIFYRISRGEPKGALEFNSPPEIHIFPQALTSKTESIRLTLFSLPRLELKTLISMSPYKEYSIAKYLARRARKKSRDSSERTSHSEPSVSEETPCASYKKCNALESRQCDVVYVNKPPLRTKLKAKQIHDDVSLSLRKKLVFDTPDKKDDSSRDFVRDIDLSRDFARDNSRDIDCWNMTCQTQSRHKDATLDKKSLVDYDDVFQTPEYQGSNYNGNDANGNEANGSYSTGNCDNNNGEAYKYTTCLNNERQEDFRAGDDFGAEQRCFPCENKAAGVCSNFVRTGSDRNGNHQNGSQLTENGSSQSNGFSDGYQQESISSQSLSQALLDDLKSLQPEAFEPIGNNIGRVSGGSESALQNDKLSGLSLSEQISNGSSSFSVPSRKSFDTEGKSEAKAEVTNKAGAEVTAGTEVTCRAIHERSQSCSSYEKNQPVDRLHRSESYCGARPRPISLAAKLSLGACTVPVFHPKTGLPVASSPAPTKKPVIARTPDENKSQNNSLSPSVAILKTRTFSTDECIPQAKLFSRSAPASTRLLGNFEESVLKGRMPIFGTVEGFTAKIGASGSFCPSHITCPVKAQFFRTSDDNAPSPYLGHISLRNAKGKKGYHVPRKGTVQLTLFNPHNTVVKVFFVLYDFSDMPSNSHTFLRQRIVSVRKYANQTDEQQILHYLVHLRFASTKREHIYLHTDVRLIFPQQSPDVTSSKLKVLTDGPLEPKYTPRDR